EITMTQSRAAGGHAMAAPRELSGAARRAAYAGGQAAAVAHVAAHELGASAAGSATNSLTQSARWSWMISGCATTFAGRCSTADLRHSPWSSLYWVRKRSPLWLLHPTRRCSSV